MKLHALLLAAAISGLVASTSHASVVTHTGDTTLAPVYTRPVEDLSALSVTGAGVRYDRYTFSVATAGTYSVLTTGTFDTFSTLYSPSFAPLTPLTNAKIANDDLLSFNTSGYTYALAAGVNYTVVTTGFDPTAFGVFSTTIGGAGAITPAVAEGPTATSPLIYTRTGDTTGGPTYTRAVEDLTALSVVGAGVHYDTFRFRVTASGSYSFLTTGDFDTFDFLYSPSFNPASALTNATTANDDLLSFGTSGFLASLVAGVDYTFVTTGFDPNAFGFFSSTIGGPGSIIPIVAAAVPEPATAALLMLGLGAAGFSTRRRKAVAA